MPHNYHVLFYLERKQVSHYQLRVKKVLNQKTVNHLKSVCHHFLHVPSSHRYHHQFDDGIAGWITA